MQDTYGHNFTTLSSTLEPLLPLDFFKKTENNNNKEQSKLHHEEGRFERRLINTSVKIRATLKENTGPDSSIQIFEMSFTTMQSFQNST